MSKSEKNDPEFIRLESVALAVSDAQRAKHFHLEALGLPPETTRGLDMAFLIGDVVVLLKPEEEWYGKPTGELNARITLEMRDAHATEKALIGRGVTLSDPVQVYGTNPSGAFLDSEGNKPGFCSAAGKS